MSVFTWMLQSTALGRSRSSLTTALAALALACGAAGCAQQSGQGQLSSPPQGAAAPLLPSLAPVVGEVMAATVSIGVLATREAQEDDLKGPQSPSEESPRRFFEGRGERGAPTLPHLARVGVASGFIIDPAGYIVTGDHVVADARKIVVQLQERTQYSARLIGRDPLNDLALLKIDAAEPLPSVRWGDSDAARTGDWVLAIGNPFGLGRSASFGIISARGRDIQIGPYDDFLQIDASLNRGNSGGPTVNLAGEVIGINTAIYTPSGGSVGVGFAIPSNRAKLVIEQLRQVGAKH